MKQITPIHLIRSFEAAARLSSFTLAAQELHLTQAAISKQIKALEKELNCNLFSRSAHGVSLTQNGERYWQDIRSIINKLDKVTTQLFTQRNPSTLRIRSNISYGLDVLSRKVGWFQLHYPELTIELIHNVWHKQGQDTNVDIEIDYRSIEPKDERYQLLQQDQMFPVMSASINSTPVQQLPLIQILGYYSEWDWWLELAAKHLKNTANETLNDWINEKQKDIKKNLNILRVDNSLSAYRLASEGVGIALARSSLVNKYLHYKQLKRIDQHLSFNAIEGFHIYLTESGQTKKACREFATHLVNTKSE